MTPVMGLDLSLSATGISCAEHTDVLKPPKGCTGMERLHWMRAEIREHVEFEKPLVVIEGYAMGTVRQAGSYAIGELGGMVRYLLWTHNITYVEVPPALLKRFATGKGNATKDAVLVAAVRAGYDGDSNDGADAWWLRQMGVYANQHGAGGVDLMGALEDSLTATPGVKRTACRDEAVAKITWPEAVSA